MNRQRSSLVLLSIVIAALAMWFWVRNFDVSVDEVLRLLARLHWWTALPLFCLLAAQVALSSWRWSLIEIALGGQRPRFSYAFATGAIATGLATFLPSSLVGIGSRGLANKISGASGLRGALSGAIDQISDLTVVILLSIPAAVAFVRRDLSIYILGSVAMVLLGLVLIWALPIMGRLAFLRFLGPRLAWIERLADQSLLLKIYGISLLRLANLTLMTLAIHAASDAATVPAIVIGVPLVTLAIWAAMLPGAFGISEWSFSAIFINFGIAPGDIVLFVLANRIIWTCLSLTLALIVLLAATMRLIGSARAE